MKDHLTEKELIRAAEELGLDEEISIKDVIEAIMRYQMNIEHHHLKLLSFVSFYVGNNHKDE
ncbi:MAG: hypothetical protein ACOC59_01495 [Bacteroidota bacterium]